MDFEQQQEEITVLESMYGTEAFHLSSQQPSTYVFLPHLAFSTQNHLITLSVEITLPSKYPSSVPPTVKFVENPTSELPITFLSSRMIKELQSNLKESFYPGEVALFTWLSYLEEYLILHAPTPEDLQRPQAKRASPVACKESVSIDDLVDQKGKISQDVSTKYNGPPIFSGEPIEDRKSVFIPHCASIASQADVKLVMEKLLEDRKIAKATHNISAYRIDSPNGAILQDNDDDGETAAGSRLMHLLQVLDVKNVLVVVSRWYGGIQLGPDRFKHINNAARQILESQNFLNTSATQNALRNNSSGKRRS